jgi:hypothetical protein
MGRKASRETSPDIARDMHQRDHYRQNFFKPQINAVLRSQRKPQFQRIPSDWMVIARRLSGVSINQITILREDFRYGWKTWDGSAFSVLPDSLQNSDEKDLVEHKSATPSPIAGPPKSTTAGKSQSKSKKTSKPQAEPKQNTRKKVVQEEYNPEDGEYTAAKSVRISQHRLNPDMITIDRADSPQSVKTRNQHKKSVAPTANKRGRGGGRGGYRPRRVSNLGRITYESSSPDPWDLGSH